MLDLSVMLVCFKYQSYMDIGSAQDVYIYNNCRVDRFTNYTTVVVDIIYGCYNKCIYLNYLILSGNKDEKKTCYFC